MTQEATDTSAATLPQPVGPTDPGPELAALERFHRNCIWTGTVKAGGMGPDSPEMTARGLGTFRWIMDGLWVMGDFEQDQFVGTEKMVTWKAHYLAGWDQATQAYRALVVDNNGRSSVFRGEIDGDRFVLESLGDAERGGRQLGLRLIWDLTDPDAISWRNEASVDGGPWFLIEEYAITPLP